MGRSGRQYSWEFGQQYEIPNSLVKEFGVLVFSVMLRMITYGYLYLGGRFETNFAPRLSSIYRSLPLI